MYQDLNQTLTGFFRAIDHSTETHETEEEVLKAFLRKSIIGMPQSALETAIADNFGDDTDCPILSFSKTLNTDSDSVVTDETVDALFDAVDELLDYESTTYSLRSLIRAICTHKQMTPLSFKDALLTHLDPYETETDTPVFEGSMMATFADDMKRLHP